MSLHLLLALSSAALAGGTITGISERDAGGTRWKPVPDTLDAVVVRGGAEVTLTRGLEVADGEVIRAKTDVRVEVKMDDGGVLEVAPGTDVTIGPKGVLQVLGEVYYRVRSAFEVQYSTVEAVVEGTRFRVARVDDEHVAVEVAAGVVKVSNAGGEVRVEAGQRVVVPLAGPPGPVEKWARKEKIRVLQATWLLGEPGLLVGVMGGGGWVDDGVSPGARLYARLAVTSALHAQVSAGLTGSGSGGGLRSPASADLGWQIGSLTFAARGITVPEICDCTIGDQRFTALHLGAAGVGRAEIPLGRAVMVTGELEGGYVGGVVATGWLGLGVGL